MIRKAFLTGVAAAFAAPAIAGSPEATLAALERRYGGRLGVFALDLNTHSQIAYRASERFPMCSTFKTLAVSAILRRVPSLNRPIEYSSADILEYAPVTKAHLHPNGRGSMTLGALCAAAIEWSDNTAANLLLRELGGPHAVTAFARSLGDRMTRLDRTEPGLNTAIPGDLRDTTTPAAMALDLQKLVFGPALGERRNDLRAWMLACKTSANRIPAGLPHSWRSGNKTGSGAHATSNDVAFLLPPGRPPKIAAAYYTGSNASPEQRDEVLAAVGAIVATQV